MRIDAYNSINKLYQTNNVSSVRKSSDAQSLNDKLEFSSTAKSYQTARAAVAEASDVRMDKISRIKAQIAAGTYYISSEAVADKILSNVDTLTF